MDIKGNELHTHTEDREEELGYRLEIHSSEHSTCLAMCETFSVPLHPPNQTKIPPKPPNQNQSTKTTLHICVEVSGQLAKAGPLSSYHVGPKDRPEVIRSGDRHFHLWKDFWAPGAATFNYPAWGWEQSCVVEYVLSTRELWVQVSIQEQQVLTNERASQGNAIDLSNKNCLTFKNVLNVVPFPLCHTLGVQSNSW